MKTKVIYMIFIISVTGCVSIETPEHMVSDTIEASKDAYNTIKKKIGDEDVSNIDFSHKYIIPEGEDIKISSGHCINFTMEKARKTLNVYNIKVKKILISIIEESEKPALECHVSLAR